MEMTEPIIHKFIVEGKEKHFIGEAEYFKLQAEKAELLECFSKYYYEYMQDEADNPELCGCSKEQNELALKVKQLLSKFSNNQNKQDKQKGNDDEWV